MDENRTESPRESRSVFHGGNDTPREEIGAYTGNNDVTRDSLASQLQVAGIGVKFFVPKGHPETKGIPHISGNDVDSVRRLLREDPAMGMLNLTERLSEMLREDRRDYTFAGEIGVAADDLLAELQFHRETGDYWGVEHRIAVASWWREVGREGCCKAIIEVTGQKRSATLAELYNLALDNAGAPPREEDAWGDW